MTQWLMKCVKLTKKLLGDFFLSVEVLLGTITLNLHLPVRKIIFDRLLIQKRLSKQSMDALIKKIHGNLRQKM